MFRPLFFAAALLAAVPIRADHVVVFEDGRALRVAAFRFEETWIRLVLDGGGEVSFPVAGLSHIVPAPDLPREIPEPLPVEEVESLASELGRDSSWRRVAGRHAEALAAAAERNGLDPWLLAAVAKVESNFDPFAVSRAGACGILQLMPATAKRFGVRNVFDAEENIEGGAKYLRWLLDRFRGRRDLALAGYNAGEGAVDRHRGIPPYRETVDYVSRVLERAGPPKESSEAVSAAPEEPTP